MSAFIYVIGSFVFAALMYCIPVLTTLSFALNWADSVKFFWSICAFAQFIALWWKVSEEVDAK